MSGGPAAAAASIHETLRATPTSGSRNVFVLHRPLLRTGVNYNVRHVAGIIVSSC